MENNYIVYMHVSPSNKRYIGITGISVNQRWKNGNGYKTQQYFYRAIEKYGWDNFQHIIIAKGLTEDEAKWLEVELIREWDTTNRDKGYNISLGGGGAKGCKHTEEWKENIRKQNLGELNHFYGKTHTEETKRKISQKRMGMKPSEETREKFSKARKGKNNCNATKVICLSTMKCFDYIGEASLYYNIDSAGISNCCLKKQKYAGYYNDIPLFWMYYEDYLKTENEELVNIFIEIINMIIEKQYKKIVCLETMEIFNSIKDVMIKFNIKTKYLYKIIKKHKKYKGYTFIYYKDYLEMNGEIGNEL